jgi:hypothetical protein
MNAQTINHSATTWENLGTVVLFALLIVGGIAFNVVAAVLTGLLLGLF